MIPINDLLNVQRFLVGVPSTDIIAVLKVDLHQVMVHLGQFLVIFTIDCCVCLQSLHCLFLGLGVLLQGE